MVQTAAPPNCGRRICEAARPIVGGGPLLELLAKAELGDELLVALLVLALEIIEQ
jgi:hypothetical protein